MAQYFHVVDQAPSGDELQQANYANIVENPAGGVHYIIQTSEPNQAFVLDNVLEQPVLQPFPQQQQFLLVSSPPKPAASMQPVVLNHTLQQPVLLNNAAPPLRPLNRAATTPSTPRPRSVLGVVAQPNRMPRAASATSLQVNRPRGSNPAPALVVPQGPSPAIMNGSEMIRMEDGRILSVAEYEQIMEQRKMQRKPEQSLLQNPSPRQRPQRAQGPPRPAARPSINARVPVAAIRPPPPPPPAMLQVVPQTTPKQMTPTKQTARIIQPNQYAKMPKILRDFVPSQEIKDIINQNGNEDEFENSIRMFVLLAGGEQRLITFTTPKEDCTIQEILEQVGVAVDNDTKIGINEINKDGINIVVSVGYEDEEDEQAHRQRVDGRSTKSVPPPTEAPSPVPEPTEEPPKLVPGKMAVCTHCGILSEDFNKCQRCRRKLPENIKSVFSKCVPGMTPKKPGIEINLKPRTTAHSVANTLATSPAVTTAKPSPTRRKPPKPRLPEPEPSVVTLSSDEEDDDSSNDKPLMPVVDKEPSFQSLKTAVGCPSLLSSSSACCNLTCRTIRIGSYRVVPMYDVTINVKEVVMKIPHSLTKSLVNIAMPRRIIHKVLVSFQKTLPVIFVYLLPAEAEKISAALGMAPDGDFYYNPIAENQLHRRLVILPTALGEEDKWVFQTVFGNPIILEEINAQEANSILLKTCIEDVAQTLINNVQPTTGVRQLLIFPPGKGGISINTEDYMCLERDQFLNDVIIDFYLKYMVHQMDEKQRSKVQVFSTFFYTRLTTKPARNLRKVHPTELDSNLTAAQKRHARVKNWTKNIDLFEKDFIIVPINENAHWFLAIICFPGMKDAETFEGLKVSRELCKSSAKKKANATTIKPPSLAKTKCPISEVEDNSDKDEAEGDESEFEVEDTEELLTSKSLEGVPIKQPCILIFDSLAGAGRSRVVATLRDYLTCEYAAKKNQSSVFTKHNISGACPKIPQQNNYTDCGLYLLQYAEHFFKDPIKDYRIPIQGLKTWFEETVVTRKREDISNLIKDLMIKYGKDVGLLPAIALPTENGEPVPDTSDKDEEDADETKSVENPEEELMDTETNAELNADPDAQSSQMSNCGSNSPGSESSDKSSSRKSAMSYLKAKRIVKVKSDQAGDGEEEPKKRKLHK